MRFLSCYTTNGATDPIIKEYTRPGEFWSDWNGLMGSGKWHRTELAPDGTSYTVKWQSRTFRNGAGKSVVSTTALWVDGEHPADTRPRPEDPDDSPRIPATQAGRVNVGEQLHNPKGTWTVTESWIADKSGAQGEDRDYQSMVLRPGAGTHVYYLLTHADGHQEEWSAPDMADADFHRIMPDEQQTLT